MSRVSRVAVVPIWRRAGVSRIFFAPLVLIGRGTGVNGSTRVPRIRIDRLWVARISCRPGIDRLDNREPATRRLGSRNKCPVVAEV
jgi:hypothetical protein